MKIQTLALAFASMLVLSASAKAGDLMDDLVNMDLNSINESSADVEEIDLDALDMDQLTAEAGDDEEVDAIETCFRRFGGYRSRGWSHFRGYRNFGHRSYGHCYNSYSYACHRPMYCYRPIVTSCYTHCAPVITSYWGCY